MAAQIPSAQETSDHEPPPPLEPLDPELAQVLAAYRRTILEANLAAATHFVHLAETLPVPEGVDREKNADLLNAVGLELLVNELGINEKFDSPGGQDLAQAVTEARLDLAVGDLNLHIESDVPVGDGDHHDATQGQSSPAGGSDRGANGKKHITLKTPRDVLTYWDDLVPAYGLDGTVDARIREPDALSEAHAMELGLAEELRRVLGDDVASQIPRCDGFHLLMKHVQSLPGAGWPRWRSEEGDSLYICQWLEPEDCAEEDNPMGLLEHLDNLKEYERDFPDDEPAEIKAGWRCGEAPESDMFVVLCYGRLLDGDDEDEDGKKNNGEENESGSWEGWHWRFVIDRGQYGVEYFTDVVDLLEWHSTYRMPPEEVLGDDEWRLPEFVQLV